MFSRKVNRVKRSRAKAFVEGVGGFFGAVRRAAPWVLLLAVIVSLPVAAVYGWRYGVQSSNFHIRAVNVEGNARVSDEEIHAAIGYEGPGTNIFTIDPDEAASAIKAQLPWVKKAVVDRTLPDRIDVTIEERTFGGIALIGSLMLVDVQGVPFKPLEHEQGMDMAVVTGMGDAVEGMGPEAHDRIKEALKIIELYDKVGVSAHDRLAEVHIDPVAGYSLITEQQGVRVLIGEGNLERRLERLREVFVELERREMEVSLVRLDNEWSLERVAVLPIEGGGSKER